MKRIIIRFEFEEHFYWLFARASRYRRCLLKNRIKLLGLTLLCTFLSSPQVGAVTPIQEPCIRSSDMGSAARIKHFGTSNSARNQETQLRGDEDLRRYFALIAEDPANEVAWAELQRVAAGKGFGISRGARPAHYQRV
jgi:hypothetical protein